MIPAALLRLCLPLYDLLYFCIVTTGDHICLYAAPRIIQANRPAYLCLFTPLIEGFSRLLAVRDVFDG